MTTPAKLFGRELASYDEVDVDELLSKLTTEELNMLAKEVDPDVSTYLLNFWFFLCEPNLNANNVGILLQCR